MGCKRCGSKRRVLVPHTLVHNLGPQGFFHHAPDLDNPTSVVAHFSVRDGLGGTFTTDAAIIPAPGVRLTSVNPLVFAYEPGVSEIVINAGNSGVFDISFSSGEVYLDKTEWFTNEERA